jgi:hypothetical protein
MPFGWGTKKEEKESEWQTTIDVYIMPANRHAFENARYNGKLDEFTNDEFLPRLRALARRLIDGDSRILNQFSDEQLYEAADELRVVFEMAERPVKANETEDTIVVPPVVRNVLYRKILGGHEEGEEVYFIPEKPYAGVIRLKLEVEETSTILGEPCISIPKDYLSLAYNLSDISSEDVKHLAYKIRLAEEIPPTPSKVILTKDWQFEYKK